MTTIPEYTDKTILHYGNKHRGKALANVPASYLLFIYNEEYTMPPQLKKYIKDNLEALQKEDKMEKAQFNRNRRNEAR